MSAATSQASPRVSSNLPQLPPLRDLRKSRDVEDPVNNWVHRPLAYAFVASTFRTALTPNQITLLAMLVGIVAGGFILQQTPGALFVGGILLWASAILDGADGIMARAKNMSSQFGRALDGAADGVVAIATVLPAMWYVYQSSGQVMYLLLGGLAIYAGVQHMIIYDQYKETYLRETRLDRGGESEDFDVLAARERKMNPAEIGWMRYYAFKWVLLGSVGAGERFIRLTNPIARDVRQGQRRSEHTAAVYRKHNYGPMQLWTLISSAPHSYLLAISLMLDHPEFYFWFRLVVANVIVLVAMIWQRIATLRTVSDLADGQDAATVAAAS